jgi:hypothetical protein
MSPEIIALLQILAQTSGPAADAMAHGSTLQDSLGGPDRQTIMNRIQQSRGSTPGQREIEEMLRQILMQSQDPDPGMAPGTVGEARNWRPKGV